MKISEVILPLDIPAISSAAGHTQEPQFAIFPIQPEKPRPQMDPFLLVLLKSKRLELDNKQMAVRLKRCRKGQPPNPKWEQTWAAYKQSVLDKVVAEYQLPIGTGVIAR
jgi:hypothetical protein